MLKTLAFTTSSYMTC